MQKIYIHAQIIASEVSDEIFFVFTLNKYFLDIHIRFRA